MVFGRRKVKEPELEPIPIIQGTQSPLRDVSEFQMLHDVESTQGGLIPPKQPEKVITLDNQGEKGVVDVARFIASQYVKPPIVTMQNVEADSKDLEEAKAELDAEVRIGSSAKVVDVKPHPMMSLNEKPREKKNA